MTQVCRHFTTVLRKLRHHLLVQPDVHFGGTVERAAVMQLFCELLARGKAAVEIKQLHEIDDRLAPVELFSLLGRNIPQDCFNVDRL